MRKETPMTRSLSRAPLLRDTLRFAAVAAVLGSLFGLAPLGLPTAHGSEPNHLRIGVGAYGGTHPVEVGVGKSVIVDLPADVQEVIVSNPEVAGAIMRSKRRAIIQGKLGGDTNIFFLDRAGEAISILDLSISPQRSDTASVLRATLARVLPGSRIDVEAIDDSEGGTSRVVLSGTARSGDDIAKAFAIASQFAGGESNVASVVTTSAPQQVMLKVVIAEVNRQAVKQFGINLSATANFGGVTTGFISAPAPAVGSVSQVANPNAITAGGNIGPVSIQAMLRALEQRNALRTLAEPVLTAISGQAAEFLVGGQLAVPTVDEDGRTSLTFKDFGVKLNFTPTVRSNGVIGLVLETSVSEPVQNSIIQERRAKTSVELSAGQTLTIAGLLQDTTSQQISRLPGLGDIPILGTLFRSRDFVRRQTELIVLVTPVLAFPENERPFLPTDNMVPAGDAEAIFLGRMEEMYGVGPNGMRGGYSGAVGFVLD